MSGPATGALYIPRCILRRCGAAIVVALLILAIVSIAGAVERRPFCDVCRRYTDASPCRFRALMELDDHTKTLDACSLFCLCEMLERYDEDPSFIFVIDYPTLNTENERAIHAKLATYLYDTEGDEQEMHEPYLLAFSGEEDAGFHQKELGGEIMDWETVLEICTELAADWEPPQPHTPGPNKRGNR